MLIKLENISKVFNNGDISVTAVDEVDLEIDKYSFIAISGPSGSGKSTLLNIIGLIDTATTGKYYFDGNLVDHNNSNQINLLRSNDLGFIFQNFNLLPVLTATENLQISSLYSIKSSKERKEKAEHLLEQVGLIDKKDNFPNQLSGGQQQRVAIARALMRNAKLVLADEPTANLDSTTALNIIELMQKLNQDLGCVFLFSTHDEKLLNQVNTIIKIKDGRLVK
jgi:putative ABC transport system ATP-binding protein